MPSHLETMDNSCPTFCIWCNNPVDLVKGKKYCQSCESVMYKECRRCHRPFPSDKYFTSHPDRCNSCQKRYMSEKNSRKKKKDKLLRMQADEDTDHTTKKSDTSNDEGSDATIPLTEKTKKQKRAKSDSSCDQATLKKKPKLLIGYFEWINPK